MTSIAASQTDQVHRIARGTLVTIRTFGVFLPQRGQLLMLELHAPELMLLERLGAGTPLPVDSLIEEVATRAACDPASLRPLVEALVERDSFLDPHGAAPAAPSAPQPVVAASGAGLDIGTGELILVTPLTWQVTANGFEHVDHGGRLQARVSAQELSALSEFAKPTSRADAFGRHQSACGPDALDEDRFDRLIGDLSQRHLLLRSDPGDSSHHLGEERTQRVLRSLVGANMKIRASSNRVLAIHDKASRQTEERLGTTRTPIVPVHRNGAIAPLGLGMIMAYAKAWEGGRLEEHFDFRPDWLAHERDPAELVSRPGIFLFSNYIWSHPQNIITAERIKALSPKSVAIHGGPDTPKYRPDVLNYFRENPHVDVAVHVEGEVSTAEVLAALAPSMQEGRPDLSALRDVPGISFRDGDHVVQTPDRDRLTDIDVIPSPYLTGLFDTYGNAPATSVTIETNRGCPYGCTFCDWGSLTMSRIRKFDLDRVFAELEWCAQKGIAGIGFADANFGILERDVAIAEKVAELKETYGFPEQCGTNYAKNTTKHIKKIVETWVNAGIITQGMLSLQTMDEGTLIAIRRTNIKTAKYDELAESFRNAKLPLFIDLMMGLPGQTVGSFRHDLQDSLEREVVAKIHFTTLLANSPMNEPSYKAEHQIEIAKPGAHGVMGETDQAVVSSSTFTREEYDEMRDIRRLFLLVENFGVLRQVSRFVRHETGLLEIDLYERLRLEARSDRERWPILAFTLQSGPDLMAPPVSWSLLLDEVRLFVTEVLGMPDDDALDTVLRAQLAMLPSPDRVFPEVLELAHDYVEWHRAMLEAKAAVGPDWPQHIPRLRDLPPGTLRVDDPHQVSSQGLGYSVEQGWLDSWDLDSPLARPMLVREME